MEILNVEFYSIAILLILIIDYVVKFKHKFTTASLLWLTIAISTLLVSISNIFLILTNLYVIKLISLFIYLLATLVASLFIFLYIKYIYINKKINIKKELTYVFISILICIVFAIIYIVFSNYEYLILSFNRIFLNKLLIISLIPNIAICILYIYSQIKTEKNINFKIIVTMLLTIIGLFFDIINESLFFVSAAFTLTTLIIYINKHEKLLNTDPLTGLYNKRALHTFIEHLRANRHIAAFNIDVNKFKLINDTYGHHKGDLILKNVSKILSSSARERDLIIRNGGDEFLIIATIRNDDDGNKILERINKNLENYNKNAKIKIGLSIGWDIYKSGDKTTIKEFENFLKSIDGKMYQEKKLAHKNEK